MPAAGAVRVWSSARALVASSRNAQHCRSNKSCPPHAQCLPCATLFQRHHVPGPDAMSAQSITVIRLNRPSTARLPCAKCSLRTGSLVMRRSCEGLRLIIAIDMHSQQRPMPKDDRCIADVTGYRSAVGIGPGLRLDRGPCELDQRARGGSTRRAASGAGLDAPSAASRAANRRRRANGNSRPPVAWAIA